MDTKKQCAHLARATEYMTSALHDDTDPPRHRLMLATPWPELPDQPSDRGSNLPGDAMARRRALCRAPCREFIRVVQVTRNTMIELVRFLQFKLVLCTAFRGVSCAARGARGRFRARRRRGDLNVNSNRLIMNSELHVGIINQNNLQHNINSSPPQRLRSVNLAPPPQPTSRSLPLLDSSAS